jgi:peptidoglycan/LPS O-acetylase OafA/YrhL
MVMSSADYFQQTGGARDFLLRRVARIVPLYWISTTFFLLIMYLTPEMLHSGAGSAWDVIRSYCFIPYGQALSPVYKLGWTLNYEMFFYACFALVLFLPRGRAVLSLTVLFLGMTVAGYVFRPEVSVLRFWTGPMTLEFIMGAWIGMAFTRELRISRLAAAALMALAVALVWSGFFWGDKGLLGRSLYWGLPGALFVAGGTLGDFNVSLAGLSPLVFIGDASYSLYLWHPFVLRLIRKIWLNPAPLSEGGLGLYVLGSLVTTVFVACLIYEYLEKPLTRLARNLLGVGAGPLAGQAGGHWP